MSSEPPDLNELIKAFLVQQQQQQQLNQQQSYQQQQLLSYAASSQPNGMPPQAALQAAGINSSLGQLMQYLKTAGTKPKPAPHLGDINAQLQRFLESGKPNASVQNGAVAPTVPHPQINVAAQVPQNGFSYQGQLPQYQTKPAQQLVQQRAPQPLSMPLNQQQQNVDAEQLQESLLKSIDLLATINPGLLQVALAKSFNITSPSPRQQMQQQTRPQQGSFQQVGQKAQTTDQSGNQVESHSHTQELELPIPQTFFERRDRIKTTKSQQKRNSSPITEAASFAAQGFSSVNLTTGSAEQQYKEKAQVSQLSATGSSQQVKVPRKRNIGEDRNARPTEKASSTGTNQQKKQAQLASTGAIADNHKAPIMGSASVAPLPLPIHTPEEDVIQTWPLEKLEMHVQKLKLARQPIPRHAAILLFNSRRKEEKLQAKRLSNRKSATNMREKKRAFIEALAKKNEVLRKRVFILQNMPDLVITINVEGDIKFCSSQVEQFLKHKSTDLVGAKIQKIVAPDSVRTLEKLLQETIATTEPRDTLGSEVEKREAISNESSDARSSEKSFPMLEVNVDDVQTSTGDDVSDSSADRRRARENSVGRNHESQANGAATDTSSLTRQKSSFGTESSEVKISHEQSSSINDSNTETRSKEMEAAEHGGIHRHKEHVNKESTFTLKSTQTADRSFSSTAESSQSRSNNKKKSEYEEDDSGYRESNESPGDSSSSYRSSKSERGKKRHRLVPIYKVRFIRDDLTSVWCELTSSFCTRSSNDDDSSFDPNSAYAEVTDPRGTKNVASSGHVPPKEEATKEEEEILICIRPTYESKTVGEDCRYMPTAKAVDERKVMASSDGKNASGIPTGSSESGNSANASSELSGTKQCHKQKKCMFGNNIESKPTSSSPAKKGKSNPHQESGEEDAEVAESLILMSHNAP